MSLRDLRPLLAAAVIGVAVALLQTLGAVGADVLALLPSLLLALPLLRGRYVGERRLRVLIARWRRMPPRVAAADRPVPRAPRRLAVRGLLLAARLGGRAPPRRPLAAR